MRPRLLFLCQTVPYPPDGGVWIRTYHVLRLLARTFDITALCFERASMTGGPGAPDVAAARAALSAFARLEVFAVPQRRSRIRFAWDHTRSIARGRAYTEYLYESGAFQDRLRELLRSQSFDVVHADSLDLAGHFPECHHVPLICVHHDVNSALLGRRAAIERNACRRAYLHHQSRLARIQERAWCGRIALNVTVSEQDRLLLSRLVPGARVQVVPNGVDTDEFRPDGVGGHGVAYVGGTHWFPNLDALEFFAADIWPHVTRQRADLAARWIGTATAQHQRQYRERHGIELTGYVADVRPAMQDAACHIVPLRAGGGTRLKILNSWAMGKPVVSTSIGCEGLAAVDGENILIRDDPREFADAVLMVLDDEPLRRRLGTEGRKTVEQMYAWDVIGRSMIDAYLAASRRAGPPRESAGKESLQIHGDPGYCQP